MRILGFILTVTLRDRQTEEIGERYGVQNEAK